MLGVVLVIGSACCFGTLGIFGKLAYRLGLSTPQLLSYRFALAALLLWLVALFSRQHRLPLRSVPGLVLMGGAGYVGQSASYFSALHYIPASTNALLLYTYPVVVTLLAALLFGERLSRMKLGAVGLAFLGTLLVIDVQLHAAPLIGIVLGLGSAAFYTGYILYGSRLLPGLPPLPSTALIMSAAAAVWSGYALATGQLGIEWTAPRAGLLASFAVVGTAVPILTFILGPAFGRRLAGRHPQYVRAGQHRAARGCRARRDGQPTAVRRGSTDPARRCHAGGTGLARVARTGAGDP